MKMGFYKAKKILESIGKSLIKEGRYNEYSDIGMNPGYDDDSGSEDRIGEWERDAYEVAERVLNKVKAHYDSLEKPYPLKLTYRVNEVEVNENYHDRDESKLNVTFPVEIGVDLGKDTPDTEWDDIMEELNDYLSKDEMPEIFKGSSVTQMEVTDPEADTLNFTLNYSHYDSRYDV